MARFGFATRDKIEINMKILLSGREEVRAAIHDIRELDKEGASSFQKIAAGAGAAGFALFGFMEVVGYMNQVINEGRALAQLNAALRETANDAGIASESIQFALANSLQGVVTNAEASEFALKAIQNGASSVEEVTAAVMEDVEALGLMSDGARTAAGELAALSTQRVNLTQALSTGLALEVADTFGGGGSGGLLDQLISNQMELNELRSRSLALQAQGNRVNQNAAEITSALNYYNAKLARTLIEEDEAFRDLIDSVGYLEAFFMRLNGEMPATESNFWDLVRASQVAEQAMYNNADAAAAYEKALILARIEAANLAAVSFEWGKGAQQFELRNNPITGKGGNAGEIEKLTRSMGGYASSIGSAEEAMLGLIAATGSYFDQARRAKDFNPGEIFYQSLVKAGASAAQLRDYLISSGLESTDRANEIFAQAQYAAAADLAAQRVVATGASGGSAAGLATALQDPAVSSQYAGATVVQGGQNVTINFHGDVINHEELMELIDQYLQESFVATGGTT